MISFGTLSSDRIELRNIYLPEAPNNHSIRIIPLVEGPNAPIYERPALRQSEPALPKISDLIPILLSLIPSVLFVPFPQSSPDSLQYDSFSDTLIKSLTRGKAKPRIFSDESNRACRNSGRGERTSVAPIYLGPSQAVGSHRGIVHSRDRDSSTPLFWFHSNHTGCRVSSGPRNGGYGRWASVPCGNRLFH